MCTYKKVYRFCALNHCRARYLHRTENSDCDEVTKKRLKFGHCQQGTVHLPDQEEYNTDAACPECKAREEDLRREERRRRWLYNRYVTKHGSPYGSNTI
jgi:hypothetical protein